MDLIVVGSWEFVGKRQVLHLPLYFLGRLERTRLNE